MKIQEAVHSTGMSKKALQYYEDKHLIDVCKDTNGYRIYDEECIHRLWQIKVLRKLDFSIQEIEGIMKHKERETIFKKHFNEIDQRIAQCMIQKDYLQRVYENVDFVNDITLLQQVDSEIEEDFMRNKDIIIDINSEKKKHYTIPSFLMIMIIVVGLLLCSFSSNTGFRNFGYLLIGTTIYSVVTFFINKKMERPYSLLNIMIDDTKFKMNQFIERRKR